MEKIRERNFLYFWGPQVAIAAASILASVVIWMFVLIAPVVGFWLGLIINLVGVAAALFVIAYRVYFYYRLSLDINTVCEGDGLESTNYLYVILLDTVTFGIYGLVWIYKMAQRLKVNAPRYGFKMIIGGKEMVVLDILSGGWISTWEFVRNMNRFAKVYNQQGLPESVGGVL